MTRTVALAEVAQVNPRGGAPEPATLVSFVPMAELDATTASTGPGVERPFREVQKGYTVFRDRDILVAKITPCFENGKIGQATITHDIGVGSTEFHVVRPDPESVTERYLLHFLRQHRVRAEGERRMTGSAGQKRVPASFLGQLQLPLPSLDEQRRIAAILDQADALRDKRRQTLTLLDDLTQAVFLDMFGDPDDAIAKGSARPLSDFVKDLQGGKSLVASDAAGVSRHRVLKISAVTQMRFRPYESKAVPDDYQPPLQHRVRAGDLLISRANTEELVGALAYVWDSPPNLLLPDKLWRFVWRTPDEVEPLYVWALLQTPAMRRQLSTRSSGTGGSMKNISKAKLLAMPVPWSPVSEQQRFAEVARSVGLVRGQAEAHLAAMDTGFASLQSRAFAGELRVAEAEADQPAVKLSI